jgi:cytochrome c biogenesis protein CcmG/thiol:disulfide interchange protein DsbE
MSSEPIGVEPHGRRRAGVLAALLAAALATVGALLFWPSGSGAAPSPVAAALPFHLDEVRTGGGPVALAARPGHPVVLNFFAAWCDPCHAELPVLADLQRRMGTQLQVVGVDVQDNRDLAAQMLADSRVGFAAGYDPDRAVSGAWGVDGLPVTVFIAPDGTVVNYHRGQLGLGSLTQQVNALLSRSRGLA